MSTTVTYGTLWHRYLGRFGEDLTEDQARARHDAREMYAAMISEDGRPVAALEVVQRPPLVKVFFLDEERRDVATYVFSAHPDGDGLWLEQTFVREIVDRRTIVAQEWVVTHPDGLLRTEVYTRDDPTRTVTESTFDPADFPELREPFPAFGDYASITRWERTAG